MSPLIIDIAGLALNQEDKLLLKNPFVAGVILFARNYENPEQLANLIKEIRSVAIKPLLVTVDHEGGRVQRFKEGFTLLPPAQSFAELNELSKAKSLAFDAGWLLAMELLAFDIDLSYAPVLDLGHQCLAIGSRSFHQDPVIAFEIASAMIDGMHFAGMKTTGKHFPGHGHVIADSHKESPIDSRGRPFIDKDMQIFSQLIKAKKLDAIMPAHVIYSAIDERPASASSYWLKQVLRQQLQFDGVIFSDDLSMEGAAMLGSYGERAKAALTAGCDLLLACNNRQGTFAILEQLSILDKKSFLYPLTAESLMKKQTVCYSDLIKSPEWKVRHDNLIKLNQRWIENHENGNY